MDVKDFLERYHHGRREFSWVDLRGADLQGEDLAGIQLYHANLTGANLSRVNFAKADLRRAILVNTKLNGTSFLDADLSRAHFDQADASGAVFLGAILPSGLPWKTLRQPSDLSPKPIPDLRPLVASRVALSARATLIHPRWSPTQLRQRLQRVNPILGSQSTPDRLPMAGAIALLLLGYMLFGLLLGLHQAPVGFWLLAWLPALLWGLGSDRQGLDQRWFGQEWLVPVGATAAVALAIGLAPWVPWAALGLAALLFLLFYSRFQHRWSRALPEALEGTGLAVIAGAVVIGLIGAGGTGWAGVESSGLQGLVQGLFQGLAQSLALQTLGLVAGMGSLGMGMLPGWGLNHWGGSRRTRSLLLTGTALVGLGLGGLSHGLF
jgi:hypothetical protein